MEIVVRRVEWKEVQQIIENCRPEKKALAELERYRKDYFGETGERVMFRTGHPDEVQVAILDDRIVGYLHYYTDCWDDYQKILITITVDSSLPSEHVQAVKKQLEEEFNQADM